ncbi:hypothetical protein, partial [Vibrio sp. Y184]|uniref:hypothetical protein n=1 Tax=Vibrio sp. Y184 TaxID=3074705 RepID=UPI002966DE68
MPKPNQTLTTGHHDDFGTDFGTMGLIWTEQWDVGPMGGSQEMHALTQECTILNKAITRAKQNRN